MFQLITLIIVLAIRFSIHILTNLKKIKQPPRFSELLLSKRQPPTLKSVLTEAKLQTPSREASIAATPDVNYVI